MNNAGIPATIKAAITRFDNAAQDYAFRGSYHPDDADEALVRYEKARRALERQIAKLMKP